MGHGAEVPAAASKAFSSGLTSPAVIGSYRPGNGTSS